MLIDVYGKYYVPTINNKPKYKTYLGSILTIITVILTVIFTYFFGREVIEKKNPKEIATEILSNDNRNLSMDALKFAFIMEDKFGVKALNYDKYLVLNAIFYNLTYNVFSNGTTSYTVADQKVVKFHKCVPDDFPVGAHESFKRFKLQDGYCLDNTNLTLLGYWGMDRIQYLEINLETCKNTTESNNCASPDDILTYQKTKIYFTAYYPQIEYNSKNFLEPVNVFINKEKDIFDVVLCKKKEITISNYQITTNKGFIVEDLYDYYNFQLDTIKSDLYALVDNFDPCMMTYSVFASNKKYLKSRSYLQVPEVLAQLGGIINLFFISCTFFCYELYHREMQEHIITKIFSIYKKDVNDYIEFGTLGRRKYSKIAKNTGNVPIYKNQNKTTSKEEIQVEEGNAKNLNKDNSNKRQFGDEKTKHEGNLKLLKE